MELATRIDIEKQIASKIVQDALALGYVVTVYDGEEYPVKKSSNYSEIMEGMFSTDQDILRFRNPNNMVLVEEHSTKLEPKFIGDVSLVYGNDGYDVIQDNTDNAAMQELLSGAEALAEELESKHT